MCRVMFTSDVYNLICVSVGGGDGAQFGGQASDRDLRQCFNICEKFPAVILVLT